MPPRCGSPSPVADAVGCRRTSPILSRSAGLTLLEMTTGGRRRITFPAAMMMSAWAATFIRPGSAQSAVVNSTDWSHRRPSRVGRGRGRRVATRRRTGRACGGDASITERRCSPSGSRARFAGMSRALQIVAPIRGGAFVNAAWRPECCRSQQFTARRPTVLLTCTAGHGAIPRASLRERAQCRREFTWAALAFQHAQNVTVGDGDVATGVAWISISPPQSLPAGARGSPPVVVHGRMASGPLGIGRTDVALPATAAAVGREMD